MNLLELDKEVKMKFLLLICLLLGCLVSPVCAQESNWTLEEFVQKLEDGQPWTKEKVEAQLGVKLTNSSSTGVVTWWYPDPGQFVYGEGLIVNKISYDIRVKTNEMKGMEIELDDKSSCFTRERIKKLYPGGEIDDSYVHPGGSVNYEINRGWGWLAFHFGDKKQWKCLTGVSISINRVINIASVAIQGVKPSGAKRR